MMFIREVKKIISRAETLIYNPCDRDGAPRTCEVIHIHICSVIQQLNRVAMLDFCSAIVS
jgi:hypothetical protein